jgi:uroporphyrinogen decarboxylase
MYCPDAVTVGIDVYNIEAEALGCQVRFYDDISIPGIITHPFTIESDFGQIAFSPDLGRIQTVLDAASNVNQAIGGEVKVSVGICGPYSIMMELLGFEAATEVICDGDERIGFLLDALLKFQQDYCSEIVSKGLGVTVFESWASPPLISPGIYREFAFAYERSLMEHLKRLNVVSRPLVIGGDTRAIADDLLATGSTLLVSDYNAPLEQYIEKARAKDVFVRANIDPKLIQYGAWGEIETRVREIRALANTHHKLLAGTGVIPYNTPPENLLRVKRMLEGENL